MLNKMGRRSWIRLAGMTAAGLGAVNTAGKARAAEAASIAPAAPAAPSKETYETQAKGIRILPGQWRPHYPWEHIASWYIETVHGADLPEFLIDARIRRKDAGKASDGGNSEMLVEWAYINKVWSKAFLTPYVNARGPAAVT